MPFSISPTPRPAFIIYVSGYSRNSTKICKMLLLTVKFVSVSIDWIYDNGIFIQLSLYYIVLYCIFIQHYTNIKQLFFVCILRQGLAM